MTLAARLYRKLSNVQIAVMNTTFSTATMAVKPSTRHWLM